MYESRTCIVFRCDESTKKFDTSGFNPKETENRLSTEDVERVMKAIEPYLKKSTKNRAKDCLEATAALLIILLCVTKIWGGNDETDLGADLIMLVLAIIGFVVYPIVHMISLCRVTSILNTRRDKIRSVIEEENQTKFRNLDIRWVVSDSTEWIRVELDFISRRLNPSFDPGNHQRFEDSKLAVKQSIPYMLKVWMKRAPKASRIRQVFLYSADSYYDTSSFDEAATEGRVTRAEVDQVVN